MITKEKILKKYDLDISQFSEIISEYYKYNFKYVNPNYDEEKANFTFTRITNLLEAIISIAQIEKRIKEPFKIFSSELEERTPRTAFLTRNTEFKITIGLFRDFYIVWEIPKSDMIKSMKDDFWMLLFEFASLGKFEYIEKNVNIPDIRKKHKILFNKRGNFYRLFRNYFLTQAEYKETKELGHIRLNWKNNIEGNILLPKIIEAIGILYKINKMLYKEYDKNISKKTNTQ